MNAAERQCLHCGETKTSIKRDGIVICGVMGGHEYRELEAEWPRHRWVDWTNAELARRDVKPEAFAKHRRTSTFGLEWLACEDSTRGHNPAKPEDTEGKWPMADYAGQCLACGKDARTTEPTKETP